MATIVNKIRENILCLEHGLMREVTDTVRTLKLIYFEGKEEKEDQKIKDII